MSAVAAAALEDYARRVLRAAGYRPADAAAQASLLLDASLRGVDSHGVATLLPVFVGEIADGRTDPTATPAVGGGRGACVTVDGVHAPGAAVMAVARREGLAAAGVHGVGAVAVRRCGYLGALAGHLRPVAAAGRVSVLVATSQACVAPHGGREALHGTNPIAALIPAEPAPIAIDSRTNALRMADWWAAHDGGGEVPAGGLLDAHGQPTTDPAAADDGVFLPAAGARGYALAILVDVLAACLAGAPVGRDVPSTGPAELAAFLLVLDPAAFGPEERFGAAVGRLAAQVAETAPIDPGVRVRLPGARGDAVREERLRDGIPVSEARRSALVEALSARGIEIPFPAA